MAINYPANLRGAGITSGALRQLRQTGVSTGSTNLVARTYLDSFFKCPQVYFRKTEPPGKFMEALDITKQKIEENTEAIRASAFRLVDTAKEANKSMNDVSGKVRDGADKLSAAITKFMKVVGQSDFEKTVHLTEQLASAIERLAALEERGLLDKVMRAMAAGRQP